MNILKYAVYYIAADKKEVRETAQILAHNWVAENMQDEPTLSHKRTLAYQGFINGYMRSYCKAKATSRLKSEKLAKLTK